MQKSTELEFLQQGQIGWRNRLQNQKFPHYISFDSIAKTVEGFEHIPGKETVDTDGWRTDNIDEQVLKQWREVVKVKRLHKWALKSLQFNLINITPRKAVKITEKIGKNFPEVENLNVHLSIPLDNASFQSFSKALSSQFLNVKNISLEIYLCLKVTDVILAHSIKSIGLALRRLKHFSFSFERESKFYGYLYNPQQGGVMSVTSEGYKKLISRLTLVCPGLLSFIFKASNKGVLTNEALKSIGRSISQRLPRLQKLHFDMKNYWDSNFLLNDDGLSEFSKEICSRLTELEHLEVHIHKCHFLRGPGIKTLLELAEKQLEKLTTLSLEFSHCDKIPSKVVEEVGGLLGSFTRLTRLSLNFSKNGSITVEIANFLVIQIATHMADLTHLALNFNGCWRITEENIKTIGEVVSKHLKKLRHFRLHARETYVEGDHLDLLYEVFKSASFKLNVITIDLFTFETKQYMIDRYSRKFLEIADRVFILS